MILFHRQSIQIVSKLYGITFADIEPLHAIKLKVKHIYLYRTIAYDKRLLMIIAHADDKLNRITNRAFQQINVRLLVKSCYKTYENY